MTISRRPLCLPSDKLPNDSWRTSEILFWTTLGVAFLCFARHAVLESQILIVALFALSVDLILGFAGIISLGHAAYFGIGAYTAALLALGGWGEPISGVVLGGLAAALTGFAASFLVVRGNNLTRIVTTLGIGLVIHEIANKASSVTGGADGLPGIVVWKVFGIFGFDLGGRTACVYSLAVLFIIFVLLRRLVNSPFGLSLRGLREGPQRMPAIGAPVLRRQVAVFVVSAGIAGIAGAMLAQTTQYVGLDSLSFSRSTDVLVMLALGGTGKLYGGIVGAAVFMVAQNYVSELNPVYWQFWIGALLVVIVMVAQGGIVGWAEALYKQIKWTRT
jgi:branched-chain amino acid transport system permease protein